MTVFFKLVRTYWQIGVPAFVALLILEWMKPGLIVSQFNGIVVFGSIIAAWLCDVLWISKKHDY